MKTITMRGLAVLLMAGSALLAGCSSIQPVGEKAANMDNQGVPGATYNPETRNWDLPHPYGAN